MNFKLVCICFINILFFLTAVFSLATLITSKTRYGLLELFILNPSLELGVRETSRRIQANVMLVRNELILLETCGLLKSRHVANSIQFSLEPSCLAVEPLRILIDLSHPAPEGSPANPSSRTAGMPSKTISARTEVIDDD